MYQLKKVSFAFLCLFVLFSMTMNTPIMTMAASDDQQIKPKVAIIQSDESNGKVQLFADSSESSNVIRLLDDGTQITVLEEEEAFSYVEYLDEEGTGEVLNGYVMNEYIADKEKDTKKTDHSGETDKENDEAQKEDEGNVEADIDDSTELTDDKQDADDTNEESNEKQASEDPDKSDSDPDETPAEESKKSDEDPDATPAEESDESDENPDATPEKSDEDHDAATREKEDVSKAEKTDPKTKKARTFKMNTKKDMTGIALSSPTNVYTKTSTDSKVLKSYKKGHQLKYKSHSSNWYEATVIINGKHVTGYIYKDDVENFSSKQTDYKGIALKNPTNVYSSASTNSKVLKSYKTGHILKYKSLTSDWYEATVIINGKRVTGYIHKNDVENFSDKQVDLKGFAYKNPTNVYASASTSSKVLKSYKKGHVLKYKSATANWYEAKVILNQKLVTGYIKKQDVANIDPKNQVKLRGVGLNKTNYVYETPSAKAKKIKSYTKGSVLQIRTYSKNWFEATVYVNGKKQTGYFKKSDIEIVNQVQKTMQGYALKTTTRVYAKASRDAKVQKSYKYGSKLKFKSFTKNWYEATVYVKGEPKTGYIHADDISFEKVEAKKKVVNKTKYNLTLDEAVNQQMKTNPQTDKNYAYVSKSWIGANSKVTADVLNVRPAPNVSRAPIGSLTNGTKVKILGEVNGWYQIEYVSSSWVDASAFDVLYYLDPANFANDSKQMFQFLDLSKASSVSKQELNSLLKGKGTLQGQAQAFIDAGVKNNINDLYLVSHALLETGNGMSELAQGVKYNGTTVYNMYGVGAYDGCAVSCGAQTAYNEGWTTPYKAIVGGAKFIGNNYVKAGQNTLYKMRWNPASMESRGGASHQYATDIGWASKQINTMYNLYQQLNSYILFLDIPSYK